MVKRNTSPSDSLKGIPSCAQQCVATAIQQNFNSTVCSSPSDLGCLCSHYSVQGLTLGETALICLNNGCKQEAADKPASMGAYSASAYSVCSGQTKAVSPTHSGVLTVSTTIASETVSQTLLSSSVTATTIGSSTLSSRSTSTATSLSSSASTHASILVTSTVTTSPLSSSQSTSDNSPLVTASATSSDYTTSTSPESHSSGTLTGGQAVEVSLGTIAGVGFLIALIFCCVCIRRKKERKEKKEKRNHGSFDFVDKSPSPDAAFPPSAYVIRGQRHDPVRVPEETIQHNRVYRTPPPPPPAPNTSKQRVSLVDKPVPPIPVYRPVTQWPAQKEPSLGQTMSPVGAKWKPPRPPRPDSNATTFTMFEEDGKMRQSKHIPSLPSSPLMVIRPNTRPTMKPRFAEQYTLSPEEMYHPSLSLEIPPMPEGGAINSHPLPSPTQLTPDSPSMMRRRSNRISMPPNSAISYLPAYYTSNDSRTPVIAFRSPYRLSAADPMPRLPPPKPSHMSYASDTTDFESVDPEEVTPPEETNKRLSDVAESPISTLRYPKIPRPSNQAVPRSPPVSRWTASSTAFSPSSAHERQASPGFKFTSFSPDVAHADEKQQTLLTKRRGEDVQLDLEQRLYVAGHEHAAMRGSSVYSQNSALRGLRVGELGSPSRAGHKHKNSVLPSSQLSPDLVIKSPLWEPELTPSKRGDDLFISVH
ncbi:hypothetical protein AAFC00_004853 [Neodothiora populina]